MAPQKLAVGGQGFNQESAPTQLLKVKGLRVDGGIVGAHIDKKSVGLGTKKVADQGLLESGGNLGLTDDPPLEIRIVPQCWRFVIQCHMCPVKTSIQSR